jgi:hypothetical protein
MYVDNLRGLAALPAVRVNGEEYSGVYLAQFVGLSATPEAEAERTPALLASLGRLVARAQAELEAARRDYRVWRDSTIHRVTNDVAAALAAGFDCALNPGVDAKGNPKRPQTPSATAAETYVRTLPEYAAHWDRQNAAEEAWATLHAALEAARMRVWSLREIVRDADPTAPSIATRTAVGKPPPPPRRSGAPPHNTPQGD